MDLQNELRDLKADKDELESINQNYYGVSGPSQSVPKSARKNSA